MQLYWYVSHSFPYWITEQYQFCAWRVAMRHYPVSREYGTVQMLEYNGRYIAVTEALPIASC